MEEIEEAAKKYAECREPHCEDGDCSPYCELMGFCCDRGIEVIKEYTEDAFKAGANWSLDNQWNDASKELPGDGIKVIVLTEKGNAAINSVTHSMAIGDGTAIMPYCFGCLFQVYLKN